MSHPDPPNPQRPSGQLLIYHDGGLRLQVRLDGASVWLTQLQIAELYQSTKQNISLHLQNIYDDRELEREATVKQYLTVQNEGARRVRRAIEHYNLTEHPSAPKSRRRKRQSDETAGDAE